MIRRRCGASCSLAARSMPAVALVILLAAPVACRPGTSGPSEGTAAPGAEQSVQSKVLEGTAAAVQVKPPIGRLGMYLVGFHPSKADPQVQMESYHYCDQVNEDFAQCVLYDGNTADARLHGIEYIVSESLYATLPEEERAYWHPHNYEVLSGQLRMPGLPDAAEDAALRTKINSYGKTWHVWQTGVMGGKSDELPIGPPHLAWSFNHDGELPPDRPADRDRRLDLDTARARERRAEMTALAHPQAGVDTLRKQFPDARPIPGVQDNGDQRANPIPVVSLPRR